MSSERRHAADATVALLVAARSSIDSAIVALQQARLLVTEDAPAPVEPLPTPRKPSPAGRAPKPRAPRKRASVGGAGPVAASPVPRILVGDPAMFTPPKRPTGAFTLQDALAYYAAEAPVIKFVQDAGPLGVVARVIVEAISGSKATKDHAAPYAALAKLEAGLVLERDGRRYRLGAGLS